MITNDLDVLFSGPDAIEFQIGTEFYPGLLDKPDEVIGDGYNISTEYVLTAKTTDLTGVDERGTVQIDSISYNVRRKIKIDDGLLTRALICLQDL